MLSYAAPRKLALYAAIIFCFLMMESPVILWANKIDPLIFGVPFLIAWSLFWWMTLTAIFLVAYLTNWGSPTQRADAE